MLLTCTLFSLLFPPLSPSFFLYTIFSRIVIFVLESKKKINFSCWYSRYFITFLTLSPLFIPSIYFSDFFYFANPQSTTIACVFIPNNVGCIQPSSNRERRKKKRNNDYVGYPPAAQLLFSVFQLVVNAQITVCFAFIAITCFCLARFVLIWAVKNKIWYQHKVPDERKENEIITKL